MARCSLLREAADGHHGERAPEGLRKLLGDRLLSRMRALEKVVNCGNEDLLGDRMSASLVIPHRPATALARGSGQNRPVENSFAPKLRSDQHLKPGGLIDMRLIASLYVCVISFMLPFEAYAQQRSRDCRTFIGRAQEGCLKASRNAGSTQSERLFLMTACELKSAVNMKRCLAYPNPFALSNDLCLQATRYYSALGELPEFSALGNVKLLTSNNYKPIADKSKDLIGKMTSLKESRRKDLLKATLEKARIWFSKVATEGEGIQCYIDPVAGLQEVPSLD